MQEITIYTDGGCIKNPGGVGGYGAVVINGKEIMEYSGSIENTTNNQMEIMAAIVGLDNAPEGSNVIVISDSQYVVKTMNREFSMKKNLEFWEILMKAEARHTSVKWVWVKGHNGDKYNERCDELATAAINARLKELKKKSVNPEIYDVKVGAMNIDIPDFGDIYYFSSYSSGMEAEDRGANPECVEDIRKFYSKTGHTFKDFIKVKAYGKDLLSVMDMDYLSCMATKAVAAFIKQNLQQEQRVLTALRWHLRGFTVKDAIRKVLVTEEAVWGKIV